VLTLDGAVAALATTAVASLFLFPDRDSDRAHTLPAEFLLGALMGLAFVLAVHALCNWRPDRLWDLVTLAIAINIVGDVVLVNAGADGDFRRGSIADTLFVASALLLTFAGFHAGRSGRALLARPLGLPVPLGFALIATGVLLLGAIGGIAGLPIVLASLAMLLTLIRMAVALQLLDRSQHEAMTDGLTGLGNRRKLMRDLDRELDGSGGRPLTLALFDLDGFKAYNDTFGHPSGDALLALCADRLATAVAPGRAYRMGGDEFCALLEGGHADSNEALARARAALEERGDGFSVTTSFGSVALHEEASSVSGALRLADARMYEVKAMGRQIEHHQTRDALLQALSEREPGVRDRAVDVSMLATAVARRLGRDSSEADRVGRAAELHDIGKMAVPDEILGKAGPLDADEWRVVKQHTIVGERILRAAPALASTAPLVRWSHERWDGKGYPDGLSGAEIPIGARIIAACDAYTAMVSRRRHAKTHTTEGALAELRRGAGAQFDPEVVDALCEEVAAERVG
jgi:two-component system, cell cycle response regulator